MAFLDLLFKGYKNKLYREVKQKVIEDIKDEAMPAPKAALQGWTPEQQKSGRIPPVKYKTLEFLYKRESWVRAAIDVIMRTSVANGFKLVLDEDVDPKSLDEEKVNRLHSLFKEPNPEDTMIDILSDIIIDLHTYGDAYLEIVSDKEGLPGAFYNVYCPSMRVLIDQHGVIQGYVQLKGDWASTDFITFSKDEIIHFKLNNPGNEVYGLAPLESLALPIETDLYAQSYNRDFFKNNAVPRLHVDMGNCTIDQLRRNREYWKEQFRGSGNSHKTIVTEGGAKITPIGTPPKDMEFLNQRKFNRSEILSVFGVPPSKVGIMEDANRANSKEQDKSFKSEKIIPLQRLIAERINNTVIEKFELPYKFMFNEVDLRDATDQAQIDEMHLMQGVVTINELRRRKGLKDVPWGNTPLIRENVSPLKNSQTDEKNND